MRRRPRGRLAASVQSVIVAVLLAAALAGASYGAQHALLRAPTRGELVAARIDQTLLRYRYVRSTIHVAGLPRRRAECLEGWQVVPGHRGSRGADVLFSDGERLVITGRRVIRLRHGTLPARMQPIAEVELAGCARALTARIYAHLVANRRTAAHPADFMGHPALALRLRTRHDRIRLFVEPRTLLPLGLRVETAHAVGWSTVDPVRPLTPALKRSFVRRFDGR